VASIDERIDLSCAGNPMLVRVGLTANFKLLMAFSLYIIFAYC
jgi:hypothetical protein